MLNYRRPSGIDEEYFVQLFVEPDQDKSAVNTQTLLCKMFQEQNISFTKVRLATFSTVMDGGIIGEYILHRVLHSYYCKCLDMGRALKVFSGLYHR